MTWRLEGLTRRRWKRPRRSSVRCGGCPWEERRKSPVRAGRLAREHTRELGHPTWVTDLVVTEYRKAGYGEQPEPGRAG